jgi:hypothetical protein
VVEAAVVAVEEEEVAEEEEVVVQEEEVAEEEEVVVQREEVAEEEEVVVQREEDLVDEAQVEVWEEEVADVVGEVASKSCFRFVACERVACLFSKLFYIEIRLAYYIISFHCRA